MSGYSELIKNFEKIRSYMREFYVYGFKSRDGYDKKSARSYDDERRRIESWLGDYMSFLRTPEGKNVFISINSRISGHNPFYKALKTKSFTDGDITLHFILFDILHSPEIILSLPEIIEKIDEFLISFENPLTYDESTVRKKLQEYCDLGIIVKEKSGKKMMYRRADKTDIPEMTDALHFFSETAPCGVIGSFLLDKTESKNNFFSFKHHYMTSALDSDVTATLFTAMHQKSIVTVTNLSRRKNEPKRIRIIPLRIFISAQNGRQHLLAYQSEYDIIKSFRIDYLSDVKIEETTPRFDELREELNHMQKKMWGVSTSKGSTEKNAWGHIEFTVEIGENEEHIIHRLEREKRVGYTDKINDKTYRFTANVYDTSEMLPWIRTFICRIKDIHFSSPVTEAQFLQDIKEMYRMYGIEED